MFENMLMALRGNFIKSKKANSNYTVLDLVGAKKEAAGMRKTTKYDLDEDGETSASDLARIRNVLLGKK